MSHETPGFCLLWSTSWFVSTIYLYISFGMFSSSSNFLCCRHDIFSTGLSTLQLVGIVNPIIIPINVSTSRLVAVVDMFFKGCYTHLAFHCSLYGCVTVAVMHIYFINVSLLVILSFHDFVTTTQLVCIIITAPHLTSQWASQSVCFFAMRLPSHVAYKSLWSQFFSLNP